MDGGSMSIEFIDELQISHSILLMQHVYVGYTPEINKIPGRIYLDEKVIPKRSVEEEKILSVLKTLLEKIPCKDEMQMLKGYIQFIQSDAYMKFTPVKHPLSQKRKDDLKDQNLL